MAVHIAMQRDRISSRLIASASNLIVRDPHTRMTMVLDFQRERSIKAERG